MPKPVKPESLGEWGGKRTELLNRLSSHKRKCLKNHKIKDIRDKRMNRLGGIVQGRRTGQEGWVGGSGMRIGTLIPGANDTMSAIPFPRFCSLSEEGSRIYLKMLDRCMSAGFAFYWCYHLFHVASPSPY